MANHFVESEAKLHRMASVVAQNGIRVLKDLGLKSVESTFVAPTQAPQLRATVVWMEEIELRESLISHILTERQRR